MGLLPVLRDTDELSPVSQCLFHFRPSDCVLRTVDNRVATLTRSLTLGVDNPDGSSFNVGYHYPTFEQRPFPVNGVVASRMGLRLGPSDRLSWEWGARPQAMGFVHEFLQHTTLSSSEALFSLSNDAASGARWSLDWTGSQWRLRFHNGTIETTMTMTGTAPTTGNQVRLWGYLFDVGGNMSVQFTQENLSTGVTVVSATSTPIARAASWASTPRIRLSSLGTTAGASVWHRLFKILPTNPTLAQILRTF